MNALFGAAIKGFLTLMQAEYAVRQYYCNDANRVDGRAIARVEFGSHACLYGATSDFFSAGLRGHAYTAVRAHLATKGVPQVITTTRRNRVAKTFKNGISLHRLLEAAPLAALATFLETADKGDYAAIFFELPWQTAGEDSGSAALREQLIDLGNELQADAAVPLDRHAQRILTLAEGRGVEPVNRVAARIFEQAHIDAFDTQLDDLGRSLWL